jgi:hypothetical protein
VGWLVGEAGELRIAPHHLTIWLVHEHHVSVLVEPQLLLEPAHAADLRRYPRGVELFAQAGRAGLTTSF